MYLVFFPWELTLIKSYAHFSSSQHNIYLNKHLLKVWVNGFQAHRLLCILDFQKSEWTKNVLCYLWPSRYWGEPNEYGPVTTVIYYGCVLPSKF